MGEYLKMCMISICFSNNRAVYYRWLVLTLGRKAGDCLKKKVVVAGAGYAGVLVAKKLAKMVKKLKKDKDIEITIIDRNPFHTMLTELHEVAAWRVEEDSIRISLKRVFARRNVKVVTDTITEIDYENRTVLCENELHAYDYLVLTSGSQPVYFGVPGAKENSFSLWSYEDAVKLREHIMEIFRRAVKEKDPGRRRQLLTFFVVGCGFTGVEMAGELAELVPNLCDRFEVDPADVRIVNMDMLDRVCTILPEKLSDKVQRRLEKMHVKVLLQSSTLTVGENYIEYKSGDETLREKTSTIIWTAGAEGSELSKKSADLGAAKRGRIKTNEFLQAINDPNVYVGGDNIFYIPEGEDKPVPQMVENAEASADTIARNLMCDLTGSGTREAYNPKFHGVMVCIGGRCGVAHVGLPGRFFALPSFLAMFAKHFINIIYFMKVLGWNKVISYMKHEFFTVRNCRSFVGGHLSNRSLSFFLVPLRVFLGFYWLYEGIIKIMEGWMSGLKLDYFFTSANALYDKLIYGTSAVSSATDAVSSATGEAAAGYVLINWNILGLARVILVSAGEAALKIQVGLVDLIVNNLVLPFSAMQMAFQIVIVAVEILIGLALIGGLMTTPAAAASLLLQAMFLTSTGLYMSSWWMLFAGIAMLFGAGRVFSLDYYVMPILKRSWKKTRFLEKWYLYHD